MWKELPIKSIMLKKLPSWKPLCCGIKKVCLMMLCVCGEIERKIARSYLAFQESLIWKQINTALLFDFTSSFLLLSCRFRNIFLFCLHRHRSIQSMQIIFSRAYSHLVEARKNTSCLRFWSTFMRNGKFIDILMENEKLLIMNIGTMELKQWFYYSWAERLCSPLVRDLDKARDEKMS